MSLELITFSLWLICFYAHVLFYKYSICTRNMCTKYRSRYLNMLTDYVIKIDILHKTTYTYKQTRTMHSTYAIPATNYYCSDSLQMTKKNHYM